MRSIHVEVRKAVIAGLVDAVGDDRVSISYGWQGSSDAASREQIFTSNARATHGSVVMNGPGRNQRREEMDFDLTVYVEVMDGSPDEAEVRAMDLGQIVEEFIGDNKSNTLGITGLNWIAVTAFASDYRVAGSTGCLAIATYTVSYNARLT